MKRNDLIALFPVHSSLRGFQRTPANMARVSIPTPHREALTNVALRIFADCTNSGVGFQEALLAIYLSGLQHARSVSTGEAA